MMRELYSEVCISPEFISTYSIFIDSQSEGDNAVGSIRRFVRVSVCRCHVCALTAEPYDLDIWHGGGP